MALNTPRPNFFIVGGPRCGTTAMYEYLKPHPQIFLPPYDKEPFYFGSDLRAPRFERFRGSEQKYLALFAAAGDAPRIGEASVLYLYSQRAAAEIHAFDPQAKIIVMLRSPVEMMYSWYSLLSALNDEDLPTFEQALQAEPARKAGQRLPARMYLPREALYYREVGAYSQQLPRYFERFGRDGVHVILFDDFVADTPGIYRQTLRFLGVDDSFQTDFPHIHANQEPRSRLLLRVLRNRTLVRLGSLVQPLAMPVYTRIREMNARPVSRPPLDPALKQRLKAEMQPEVERLSALLGRDLSAWSR